MIDLSALHIGGTPIIESILAVQKVSNYRLGDWSRDPFIDKAEIARIQSGLDRIFGSHDEPAAFIADLPMMGRGFIVHPSIAAQLRQRIPSGSNPTDDLLT